LEVLTMARTERGQYRFTAKEDAEGRPHLVLEPRGEQISAFEDALLGLDLRDTVNYAHAQQIAEILNDQVTGLSVTFFDKKADA
jgi:hypothetical protein